MFPIVSAGGSLGWWALYKIKGIFSRCGVSGFQLPNVADYLTDKAKAPVTREFTRNLQFIIVHNNMDFGALGKQFCQILIITDMVRRCNCMSATTSATSPTGLAASCTGCI